VEGGYQGVGAGLHPLYFIKVVGYDLKPVVANSQVCGLQADDIFDRQVAFGRLFLVGPDQDLQHTELALVPGHDNLVLVEEIEA